MIWMSIDEVVPHTDNWYRYARCDRCGHTASFRVRGAMQTQLANVGMPATAYYCREHLPDEARGLWMLQHLGELT